MFKHIKDQQVEKKQKELKMVEDAIQENQQNPEAVKDLEARRKKEIKEIVALQN